MSLLGGAMLMLACMAGVACVERPGIRPTAGAAGVACALVAVALLTLDHYAILPRWLEGACAVLGALAVGLAGYATAAGTRILATGIAPGEVAAGVVHMRIADVEDYDDHEQTREELVARIREHCRTTVH